MNNFKLNSMAERANYSFIFCCLKEYCSLKLKTLWDRDVKGVKDICTELVEHLAYLPCCKTMAGENEYFEVEENADMEH